MILRRIAEAFRRQDWFTVFIETMIVVVGVFVGLQVNNWNAARIENDQSRIFTQTLKNDLRADAMLYRGVADYYGAVRDNGECALSALDGEKPLSDEELVICAYRASQVALVSINRSTYDELVSTGRINLIADKAFREAAIDHFGFNFIEAAHTDGREAGYRNLVRGLIPPEAHRAARRDCGDVASDDIISLDYPCKLDIPDAVIAKAAQAIRAEAGLPAALRRRINELDVQITDLNAEAARLERTLSAEEVR